MNRDDSFYILMLFDHCLQSLWTEVNGALNSTLSRTVNTSMTTFVVLLIIFIFGGAAIKGFIFALLIGIIIGTYSSLLLASPLLTDLTKRK